ncbi:endonuclease [uncultured Flavobacterium sp.]|uniref:endonuclease n=1 Tax=uncultured Flavobacterium sp. TaxID=165435 RepID=UPI0011F64B56|nr:endonuclease [uncultured Flavobacterium sp.]THD31844.1 MAG: endonuclease [Flavobacterium johnsoniae]
MPEGPSIVILKEEARQFEGQEIIFVSGNSKIDQNRLLGKKIISFRSWGKHFLICFKDFTVRIHFLLFGTYRINETKDAPVRLNLTFPSGEINFYSSSVQILEGDVNLHYDWSADVMNESWNPKQAREKLKNIPNKQICDALLEQDIFSGVGNIIKNEVLYRVRVHPESLVGKIPSKKRDEIIKEARNYSFQFLEWKKKFELKKHWLAHTKKTCLRCDLPILKKYTGVKKRRSFFCENCQILYQ